ncbi:hypothetical protein BGZ52_004637 [Haplosporangium bisporale]|nr:hypothetical protein BGZ52_004637 [Haplosporangium bisporale]
MEDDFSFHEKFMGASEFISPLSGDLVKIQGLIQSQLIALNGLLADRNSFIFKQTTKDYSSLTKRFLVTLEQYLSSTLVDLFLLVDRIAPLMENYDYDLETFAEDCATTPQDVEQFVQDVKKMVEVHATTVSELSVTSMELSELSGKYTTNSQRAASSSDTAGAVSIGLTVGGVAVGVGAAFFFAPFVAVGTVLVISAGGGGISGLFHYYDKNKSEVYTDAATKLDIAKECSDSFKSPISAIHHKMAATGRGLETIQRKTTHAIDLEKTAKFRLASYKMAQDEAKKIKEACISIRECSLSITEMKSQVAHKAKQIEKA